MRGEARAQCHWVPLALCQTQSVQSICLCWICAPFQPPTPPSIKHLFMSLHPFVLFGQIFLCPGMPPIVIYVLSDWMHLIQWFKQTVNSYNDVFFFKERKAIKCSSPWSLKLWALAAAHFFVLGSGEDGMDWDIISVECLSGQRSTVSRLGYMRFSSPTGQWAIKKINLREGDREPEEKKKRRVSVCVCEEDLRGYLIPRHR